MTASDVITLGTRGSQLALWQANRIKDRLEAAGHRVVLETITTRGDREQDVPLSEIGDEAVFTKEIDRALLDGEVRIAVHSLKDLPSRLPDGIVLAAVSARANPFDAFVAHPSFEGSLEDLPDGATVATSSLRRRAQLKSWRPDLEIVSVRGNVDTRLEKLDASDWHGMVLAQAGLARMGLSGRIRAVFPPEIMLPAVGQGALAVTCRPEDDAMLDVLRETVHDAVTGYAAEAERGFLRQVGGGCRVPLGAWARLNDEDQLVIDASIAALDGSQCFQGQRTCPQEAGAETGAALADQLLRDGGAAIIDAVRAA